MRRNEEVEHDDIQDGGYWLLGENSNTDGKTTSAMHYTQTIHQEGEWRWVSLLVHDLGYKMGIVNMGG